MPANIKAINEKVVTTRSAAEAAALEKYHKEGVKQIANVKLPQGGVYSVAFRPDGKILAAGGADGFVRLFNPETGSLVKEFAPVTVKTTSVAQNAPVTAVAPKQEEAVETEVLPKGASLASLEVVPQGDPPDQSVRLHPAPGHRQARFGRDDRRDPDGRAVPVVGDRRGHALGFGAAQGRRQGELAAPAGGPVGRRAGDRARAEHSRFGWTSRMTSRRCCRGSAVTREPATARPRAGTASSSRFAAMTRSSTCGL